MLQTTIIILLIVIVLVSFIFRKKPDSDSGQHKPPIIGANIPLLGCALNYLKDPIQFLENVQREHDGFFTLKLANRYITMISSIEMVPNYPKIFYNTTEDQLSFYNVFNDFFQIILPFDVKKMKTFSKESLKRLKVNQHKIMPSIQEYMEVISYHLDRFFTPERISQQGYQFDAMEMFPELILLINASSVVAKELGSVQDFRERLLAMFPILNNGLEGVALSLPSWCQGWFPNVQKGRQSFLDFVQLIKDVMIMRSQEPKQETIRFDILHLLSKEFFEEKYLKEPPIRDEVAFWKNVTEHYKDEFYSMCSLLFITIYAGSTVFKSSAYTLYSVLNSSKCKMSYIQELQGLIQEYNNLNHTTFTVGDCMSNREFLSFYATQAKYAENCVKETLRRYTGPIVLRKVMKPLTIETERHGTFKIPMGNGHLLGLSPYMYHHHPDLFPNPFEFHPERFDNPDHHSEIFSQSNIGFNGGFHAFSAGKHVCLGAKIATIQSKCIVAYLLSKFDLELQQGLPEPDYSIIGIAKPKKPCIVKVKN